MFSFLFFFKNEEKNKGNKIVGKVRTREKKKKKIKIKIFKVNKLFVCIILNSFNLF